MKPMAPFKFTSTYATLERLMGCLWVPFGTYVARITPVDVDINSILNEEEQ